MSGNRGKVYTDARMDGPRLSVQFKTGHVTTTMPIWEVIEVMSFQSRRLGGAGE